MTNTSAPAPPSTRLSTAEASKYTGIAESTLRYYRHIGSTGPASYTLSSRVFYDLVDLDAWIAAEKAKSLRGGVQ